MVSQEYSVYSFFSFCVCPCDPEQNQSAQDLDDVLGKVRRLKQHTQSFDQSSVSASQFVDKIREVQDMEEEQVMREIESVINFQLK